MKQDTIDKWYRLDNSAVIYPMSITTTTQSLFRLSVELNDYIDKEMLQKAIVKVMQRFPAYKVVLRSGFFRHYFDTNNLDPRVFEDNGILFQKIDFHSNRYFLFRVTYYRRKINVDFFHGLCDGTGALEFTKSLAYQYIAETTDPPYHGNIKVCGEEIKESELEDGFIKYYKPVNVFGGVVNQMAGKDAFALKGRKFRRVGYGLIEGHVATDKLVALAKKYECTVTALLAALMFVSIAKVYGIDTQNKQMTAAIPINLRRFFPSDTLRNFTTIAKIVIPSDVAPSLQTYCKIVKKQLEESYDKEKLLAKIGLSSILVQKWYAKILPLPFKTFLVKSGKLLSANTKQTFILTNLGNVVLPTGMESYIQNFGFCPNVSRKVPDNVGVISYNNTTAISFTRKLVSTRLEREFFTALAREGLEVSVASNMREGENYKDKQQ